MECEVCRKTVAKGDHSLGYGKILCSDLECFRAAGKGYTPSNDRNRGGGVGKNKITI